MSLSPLAVLLSCPLLTNFAEFTAPARTKHYGFYETQLLSRLAESALSKDSTFADLSQRLGSQRAGGSRDSCLQRVNFSSPRCQGDRFLHQEQVKERESSNVLSCRPVTFPVDCGRKISSVSSNGLRRKMWDTKKCYCLFQHISITVLQYYIIAFA